MLFRLGVKQTKDEFFNFEREFRTLIEELIREDTRMIVIKGVRRTGKSSLLNVALNTINMPNILIDIRMLGPLTPTKLYDILAESLSNLIAKSNKLKNILGRVKGISISGYTIEFIEKNEKTLISVLGEIEKWAKNKGKLILAFDEAQDLRLIQGFDRLLAHIYDYHKDIKIVLTGSEVGILDKLLGKRNPKAALYGRSYIEIMMNRLTYEKAVEFLKLGFREQNTEIPRYQIEETVTVLDGIIGWLTSYGYYRLRMEHKEALNIVIEEGSEIVKQEIENFLATRQIARTRYLTILRLLDKPRRWIDIKRGLQMETGQKIADNRLTNYLKELYNYGFIQKIDQKYILADPLVQHALNHIKNIVF